jgi:hypothetical protein
MNDDLTGTAVTPDQALVRCKCGAARHTTDPNICSRGHAWPGGQHGAQTRFRSQNAVGMVHGLRAPGWQARRAAELAERLQRDEAALLAALGHPADAMDRLLVCRLVRAVVLVEDLERELLQAGVTTPTRRARRLLNPYGRTLDRVRGLVSMLRSGGRADLPAGDPLEAVRAAVAEANRS